MTKKSLHIELRMLKEKLKKVETFSEFVTLSMDGNRITTAIYEKGHSKTDLKLILSWELQKEKTRDAFRKKLAA
ncbi:hypothetical protein ABIC37_005374 [Priestia megaterium]|uniref:hypothetical protein n=1 Tax=Priestia megaterium TaxID=1404 RepID=UPI0033948175